MSLFLFCKGRRNRMRTENLFSNRNISYSDDGNEHKKILEKQTYFLLQLNELLISRFSLVCFFYFTRPLSYIERIWLKGRMNKYIYRTTNDEKKNFYILLFWGLFVSVNITSFSLLFLQKSEVRNERKPYYYDVVVKLRLSSFTTIVFDNTFIYCV